jgi:hypothetical protein
MITVSLPLALVNILVAAQMAGPPGVMAGAHYFAGWSDNCPAGSKPGCYSHFHGFTPTAHCSSWLCGICGLMPPYKLYGAEQKATIFQ